MSLAADFYRRGWVHFGFDPNVFEWVSTALPFARSAIDDPAYAQWHVCAGTWFVGVNALANDNTGALGGGGPIAGAAIDFLNARGMAVDNLDRAQISVMWPGYPKPREGESSGAFRYRRERDAAHVDGLRAEGPNRRRFLKEPHAFILGIPMNDVSSDAAPFVVWEGSHHIMRQRLGAALAGSDDWTKVDLTDEYQAARREVFDTCPRIEMSAKRGEAYVVHRLALHGVAPWSAPDGEHPEGRMICYFRPELPDPIEHWVTAD